MENNKVCTIAMVYDFDGTLSPGNMQEHSLLPELTEDKGLFWEEVNNMTLENKMDKISCYMYLLLKKSKEKNINITRETLSRHGKELQYFPGLLDDEGDDWFKRLDIYANNITAISRDTTCKIEHYIISSGLQEMLDASLIAKKVKKIFASKYYFDVENERAVWPSQVINYTSKTQYLFRISKNALDLQDESKINKLYKRTEYHTPFKRMIFIGDGETDIPCFSLVSKYSGHSLVVYDPTTEAGGKALDLKKDGRVAQVYPADYRASKGLEKYCQAAINQIYSEFVVNYIAH